MKKRNSYKNIDITNQRFGRLVALYKVEKSTSKWHFKCDCGNEIELPISRLFNKQKSCGCMVKECRNNFGLSHTKHGESNTKLYHKYRSMLDRCYRKDNRNYKRYGARGIKVCDEWKNSYEAFRDWAYSTGYNPNKNGLTEQSIDRIDSNGNYTPENCKWSTAKEQQANRSVTKFYPFKDKLYNASEFADEFNISNKSFVYLRLKKGQSLEYILDDWEKIHNVPKGLIEVNDYAINNNVHPATIKRWINNGKISGKKVGRKWYVIKV